MLEEPQILPIINMKVPLLPFYIIAPIFYLVIHFYVLMMLVLLARSAALFEVTLQKSIPKAAEREIFRVQAENALFLQLLVGNKEEKSGITGFLLTTIAVVTLAVAPVLNLISIQMRFLPYHDFSITWLHRIIVLVDAMLVLFLWRAYRWRCGVISPLWSLAAVSSNLNVRAIMPVLGLSVTFWLSLFEARWIAEPWIGPSEASDRRILINTGIYKDRLSLQGQEIVGEKQFREKLEESSMSGGIFRPTIDFRGRNLQYADFSDSDLRGVDFGYDELMKTKTFLRGAKFNNANLQGANFDRAELVGASFFSSKLHATVFDMADMRKVEMTLAKLQGASLKFSLMIGANLGGADLRMASFHGATLFLADLDYADLRGADFHLTQLQGASLRGNRLRGINLGGAFLFRAVIDLEGIADAWLCGLNHEKMRFDNDILGGSWDVEMYLSFSRIGFGYNYIESCRKSSPWISTYFSDQYLDSILSKISIDLNLEKSSEAKNFNALKLDQSNNDFEFRKEWNLLEFFPPVDKEKMEAHRSAVTKIYGDYICSDNINAPIIFRRMIYGYENSLITVDGDVPGLSFEDLIDRFYAARGGSEECPGVNSFRERDWQTVAALRFGFRSRQKSVK